MTTSSSWNAWTIRPCNLISPVDSSSISFPFILNGPSEVVQNISGPHWSLLPSRDLGLKLIVTYSKFRLCCKDLLRIQSHFIIQYDAKRSMGYDRYFILSLIKTLDPFILRPTKRKLYNVSRGLVSREEENSSFHFGENLVKYFTSACDRAKFITSINN